MIVIADTGGIDISVRIYLGSPDKCNKTLFLMKPLISLHSDKRRIRPLCAAMRHEPEISDRAGDRKRGAVHQPAFNNQITPRGIHALCNRSPDQWQAGYYEMSSPEESIECTGFEIDTSRAEKLKPPEQEVIRIIREEIDPEQAFIKVPSE